jgi:hypothetical protein
VVLHRLGSRHPSLAHELGRLPDEDLRQQTNEARCRAYGPRNLILRFVTI